MCSDEIHWSWERCMKRQTWSAFYIATTVDAKTIRIMFILTIMMMWPWIFPLFTMRSHFSTNVTIWKNTATRINDKNTKIIGDSPDRTISNTHLTHGSAVILTKRFFIPYFFLSLSIYSFISVKRCEDCKPDVMGLFLLCLPNNLCNAVQRVSTRLGIFLLLCLNPESWYSLRSAFIWIGKIIHSSVNRSMVCFMRATCWDAKTFKNEIKVSSHFA